jgi:multidrug resistance efflux pump
MRIPGYSSRFPTRCRELVLGPPGENGMHVVKNERTGQYFRLGAEEFFLLDRLDGNHSVRGIIKAYEQHFDERLEKRELTQFLAMACKKGLLEESRSSWVFRRRQPNRDDRSRGDHRVNGNGPHRDGEQTGPEPAVQPPTAAVPTDAEERSKRSAASRPQSILFWRKSLFDPDNFFGWLVPKIGFFWTPAFFALSLLSILVAFSMVATAHGSLVSYFARGLTWGTAALVLVTLLGVTTLHEFAHGLTCKRYGGHVHEIGFLLLYFMPAFFCNVSDSWLIPQKSKRLWVTFAGGYFELFLWSLAVFVWRLTMQDTLVNYLAWMVVTISGVRVLFNFNPLLKLDGYYMLSDLVGVANLRQQSISYVFGWVRSLLWGAPRPEPLKRGKFLVLYGVASWAFSVFFLVVMVWAMGRWLGEHVGPPGIAVALLIAIQASRSLFGGLFGGEVNAMAARRPMRAMTWAGSLVAVIAGLGLINMEKRASGTFEIRPTSRVEVRAPVAGFLADVVGDEGYEAAKGSQVARLDIPDLASRLKEKQAEIRESDAKLKLLETGARREEIQDAQARVQRAIAWRDRSRVDLARNQQAFREDLARLDQKITENRIQTEEAANTMRRAGKLVNERVISDQQYREIEKAYGVAMAKFQQAVQERGSRQSLGTLESENELASREKELAEANAALGLLMAGSRREEIDAARASRARAQEELNYLMQLQQKLVLTSPVQGVIVTHRLKEKRGQFFNEGELVCEVEGLSQLETEITLHEQEVPDVRPGQKVELKARALPFKTFEAQVDRIAPRAKTGTLESTVIVYCRLEHPDPDLLPGMTGFARIYCDPQPAGRIFLDKIMRFVRTEFWW